MLIIYITDIMILLVKKNKLLGISQVFYSKIFYKTHKHYNYLQLLLKQKVFTKVINNVRLEGLGAETWWSN